MIGTWDYCYIVSDKKMKGSGLSRGDIVLVTGTKSVPATKKDPYSLRTYVIVVKVEDGLPCIPKDDNEHRAWVVDPRNLEKVEDEVKTGLDENIKEAYGQPS